MQNLLMDFYDHPDFVHSLLESIADYNIAQIREALEVRYRCGLFRG